MGGLQGRKGEDEEEADHAIAASRRPIHSLTSLTTPFPQHR